MEVIRRFRCSHCGAESGGFCKSPKDRIVGPHRVRVHLATSEIINAADVGDDPKHVGISMPRRNMADGWTLLSGIHTFGIWRSVTAARSEDGIGVVATWSRMGTNDWSLTSWGCTEDHVGHDPDNGDPLPNVPPLAEYNHVGKVDHLYPPWDKRTEILTLCGITKYPVSLVPLYTSKTKPSSCQTCNDMPIDTSYFDANEAIRVAIEQERLDKGLTRHGHPKEAK